jgi:GT2 family glycosyltransferase
MESAARLSITIVTTDRLLLVGRLLASLSRQTCKEFNIVFVHGPSVSGGSARELAAWFGDLDITILQSADTCLSRSRNLALAAASGEIIAIADDDCVYEPDTVKEVLAAFARSGSAPVLMGRVAGLNEKIRAGAGRAGLLNRYSVFSGCPGYVHFYRAEAMRAIGPFDEQLGPGCGAPFLSGEDTDYALRALDAGFPVARVPSVLVRHPAVDPRHAELGAKVRGYAAGRMRLLYKHGFPRWFVLLNVLYPLFRLPLDCLREGAAVARYRGAMFAARLKWLKDAKLISPLPPGKLPGLNSPPDGQEKAEAKNSAGARETS